ncbi:hypothetical protein B0H34DRAFT_736567 [Crassisporium funariophilum]|nr:hypothetical protein B0H34DRAFT_739275 [Crassisporium funariophilum]KAF8148685.1 hypothetical protein B0H34DRAFT_736567 [Crassisporium funariophilum]
MHPIIHLHSDILFLLHFLFLLLFRRSYSRPLMTFTTRSSSPSSASFVLCIPILCLCDTIASCRVVSCRVVSLSLSYTSLARFG